MNRMLRRAVLILSLLVTASFTIHFTGTHIQGHRGIMTPMEIEAELLRRLADVPRNSPEYFRLTGMLEKVRNRGDGSGRTEHPDVLIEAFAQLKTAADGSTYRPNYQQRELQRALYRKEGSAVASSALLPWVERGPGNVSGRARGLAIDPGDPSGNTWLIASVGGGVWKTTDAGNNWRHLTPDFPSLSTSSIAVSPSDPDIIYVGTGMGYGRVVDLVGSGIWKSTDGGESWRQLSSTANGELYYAINRIVVDPNDANTLLVCSNNSYAHLNPKGGSRESAIFRSTDGGESWTKVFDPAGVLPDTTDNRIQQIAATPGNFNRLYAAVNEVGVIRSTDAGISWEISADNFALPADIGTPSENGFGLAGISVRTELAVSPSDPARIYAAVERPRGIADLYMSTDAGEHWVLVDDRGDDPNWFNANGQSGAVPGAYTAGWFDNSIAVHPYNENIVFVGGVNIYRIDITPLNSSRITTPLSWGGPNPQNIPYVHPDHHALIMLPDNPSTGAFRIVNANDGGIGYSTDGGTTWRQIVGMGTTQFYGADKKPGENIYIGGTQDNGTWVSGVDPQTNSTWTHVIGGDGFEAAWNYRNPDLVLGTWQGGNVHRSTDGGSSWTPVPDAKAGAGPFISKIAYSKADPDLVFTIGASGVKRSDDFGATWTLTPIGGNWLGYRPFDNIEASIADPQVVWISSRLTVDPPSGRRGGVHISTDGGLSFREISGNLPPNMTEASGIATHPTDRGTAYLLFAAPHTPKILRTTDYGETWEDISGFGDGNTSSNGFPDVALFSLLVMPYDTDIIWAGTEIGLFISTDGGSHWQIADNGIPSVSIFEMKIVDDQVVAATYGRGIWSVQLPELEGHTPPVAVLAPRLHKLCLTPFDSLAISADLRSAYDSTVFLVDGERLTRAPNATPETITIGYPVDVERTVNIQVVAYSDGNMLKSPPRSIRIFPVTIRSAYVNSLDNLADTSEFIGSGFTITSFPGFSGNAIHTSHPYITNGEFTYMLKSPIRITQTTRMHFREIVLVEEGTGMFGSDTMFDYVIVEASTDGCTWLPLLDGYDSRDNQTWLAELRKGLDPRGNSSTPGTPSMFRQRTIDLTETLAPGDVAFLRFRLYSDILATAWGWVIDDLVIEGAETGVAEGRFKPGKGLHIAPNPFVSTTLFSYTVELFAPVRLELYDMRGNRVDVLVDEFQSPGLHEVRWHGTTSSGDRIPSGRYTAVLDAGGSISSYPVMLAGSQ